MSKMLEISAQNTETGNKELPVNDDHRELTASTTHRCSLLPAALINVQCPQLAGHNLWNGHLTAIPAASTGLIAHRAASEKDLVAARDTSPYTTISKPSSHDAITTRDTGL